MGSGLKFPTCCSHMLLESNFHLRAGKPSCACSPAQLEFLCGQAPGDDRERGMATCCCCCCRGKGQGQMEGIRDRNQSEKMLRPSFQEINSLVLSLGQMF